MSVGIVLGILLVAFLAGMDGILDEWEFQQPLVACTLIGLMMGNVTAGVIFGGSLQMMTIGWMNIGASVAPDAALASIVAALWVCGPVHLSVPEGLAVAVPLALVGQGLTMVLRRIVSRLVGIAEKGVAAGHLARITQMHWLSLSLQGLRVMIPTGLILLIPARWVIRGEAALPSFLTMGLAIAGGFIAVVGYAIVINMMATKQLWPFFFLGVVLAAVKALNMIALGIIGLVIAVVYVQFSSHQQPPHGGEPDELDDLDRELEDL